MSFQPILNGKKPEKIIAHKQPYLYQLQIILFSDSYNYKSFGLLTFYFRLSFQLFGLGLIFFSQIRLVKSGENDLKKS